MSATVKLPDLQIAHRNFASSCIGACNRRFAIYQVDVAKTPFWVVEIGPDNKPTSSARKYWEHSDAIECISAMAQGALLGRDVPLPETA